MVLLRLVLLWKCLCVRACNVSNDDRLTFVRMEIIRNDKLFTKFKAAVCNMERRITANPEVREATDCVTADYS